jgi:imidazole glycerol-phosphate synthase subunit HisH
MAERNKVLLDNRLISKSEVMVAIVNYGVGNLQSIRNMLKKVNVPAAITSDTGEIREASHIILPGIGHFDYCMQQFNNSGLRDVIEEKVHSHYTPVLGICVGCQMLMEQSEEGNERGLGWLKGSVVKFQTEKMPEGYKIPHMSWSDIHPNGTQPLYEGLDDARFYFVHSYYIQTEDANVTAFAEYGHRFTASVGKGNIQGVQFHPEKSHRFGMQLYTNFQKNFRS